MLRTRDSADILLHIGSSFSRGMWLIKVTKINYLKNKYFFSILTSLLLGTTQLRAGAQPSSTTSEGNTMIIIAEIQR